MTAPSPTTKSTSIDPATSVGLLSLGVSDLERSLAFYTGAMGFALLDHQSSKAVLGAGGHPLLMLSEEPGASAWPRDRRSYTGLYHFAILVPQRSDLGAWLRHWLDMGLPMPGQGDHLVSEALYLEDLDGNGIEIYRDRPRDEWRWQGGQVRMGTGPVDIKGLLADAAAVSQPWQGLPAGTRIGHIHLQVGDIDRARSFYEGVLGFDVVAAMPTALFVSAGGYHHHVGMNVWHSLGAGPAPAGIAGLRLFTIDLPTEAAREAVLERAATAGIPTAHRGDVVEIEDPWQNIILLNVGSVADAEAAGRLST